MTVLSVVEGNNGRLIAEAARLWIQECDDVIDLTYGRGLFWSEYRPAHLVTNDLHAAGAEMHFDYTNLPPLWSEFFDVVIFDPPYISTGNRKTSTLADDADFYDRYGIGSRRGYQSVFKDVAAGIGEAARILRPGGRLFVKCMDYVESGAIRWGRLNAVSCAEAAGLVQVDEFVHYSGTGPQPLKNRDGTPRRQVHSRRAHSFLCIFRKGRA